MRKPKHYFLLSVASLILFVNISGLKQKMTPTVYCRRQIYLSQKQRYYSPTTVARLACCAFKRVRNVTFALLSTLTGSA